jgi:molybdenum cofactor biosynthesis enzyme MoaA
MKRSRIAREKKTVAAMVGIYCRGNHGTGAVCEECKGLLAYSMGKLDKCLFAESKPTCAKCSIHCYRDEMRERMRAVMRYSGPRMVFRHPALAILHSIDTRKRAPEGK